MQSKKVVFCLSSLGIIAIGGFAWRWWVPPRSRDDVIASKFDSPTGITAGLSEQVSLTINGVDWFQKTPNVESGSVAKIAVKWLGRPGDWDGAWPHGSGPVLTIAMRLPSDADFTRCDMRASKMILVPEDRIGVDTYRVDLAPGDYVVRIYLQRDYMDNQGQLGRVETDLIAETALRVTIPDEGAPSTHVPFDTRNEIFPLRPVTFGSLDARR